MRAGPPVLVVGAGPTGLTAAWQLGEDAELVERNATVGGWCRSVEEAGFTFDYAGQVLAARDPWVSSLLARLLGENVHWQDDAASTWGYPIRGGMQALADGFLPLLARPPRLRTALIRLGVVDRTATLGDGTRFAYEALVSTMPLPELVRLAGAQAPPEVREAASGLRHVSMRCVHVGVGRESLTDQHWIDFPGGTVFHRVFVQGNASPGCNPPGGFGLTFEVPYDASHPLPADGLPLVRRCIDEAQRAGLLGADDPIRTATQTDLPYADVVDDEGRAARVDVIRDWFAQHDVHLAGRYGAWEHSDLDRAFLSGRRVAEEVRAAAGRATAAAAGA